MYMGEWSVSSEVGVQFDVYGGWSVSTELGEPLDVYGEWSDDVVLPFDHSGMALPDV